MKSKRKSLEAEPQIEILTAGNILNRIIALIQCNMFDPSMPIADILNDKMFHALVEEGDYKP